MTRPVPARVGVPEASPEAMRRLHALSPTEGQVVSLPSTERLRCWGVATGTWVRSAPGTYVYLFVLLVTSWSLRGIDPHLTERVIRAESTNLDNLADRPLQVLFASAFWRTGSDLPWASLLLFTTVMAPVERRLGTLRWCLVAAAGHVGATLLTAAGIGFGLRHGLLDLDLAHVSDVGVSYALYTVAGAMTWLLVPPRWQFAWVAALLLSIGAVVLPGITFTDVGHLLSVLIGLSTAPLVARWQRHPSPRAVRGGQPILVPRIRPRLAAMEERSAPAPATSARRADRT